MMSDCWVRVGMPVLGPARCTSTKTQGVSIMAASPTCSIISDRPGPELPVTEADLRRSLVDNLYHSHGQAVQSASKHDAYMALSYAVRDYLIERWRKTNEACYDANPKFVYYLSAEYLLGRVLVNLIPYNPGTKPLTRAPEEPEVERFIEKHKDK